MTRKLPLRTKALRRAARLGRTDEVRRLLARSASKELLGDVLSVAARHRRFEVMFAVISKCKRGLDAAIVTDVLVALEGEGPDVAVKLAQLRPPSPRGCIELLRAAFRRDAAAIRALIPWSDPKAHDSEALYCSVRQSHDEGIQLLLPVSDPDAVWAQFDAEYFVNPWSDFLISTERLDCLSLAVSLPTLVAFESRRPEALAQMPVARARLAAMRLERATAKLPNSATVQRVRL